MCLQYILGSESEHCGKLVWGHTIDVTLVFMYNTMDDQSVMLCNKKKHRAITNSEGRMDGNNFGNPQFYD